MISRILPVWVRTQIAKIVFAVYKGIGSKDTTWVVPSHYFTDLTTIKFYGMEFRVPAKTEEYLAFRYGLNWQIPKKDWITEKDDGTVASNQNTEL